MKFALTDRMHLRIKVNTLAYESRIIRERATSLKPLKTAVRKAQARDLMAHRAMVVSEAAREAGLALAFLNGTPYERAEGAMMSAPSFTAIARLAERFGPIQHPEESRSAFLDRQAEFRMRLAHWTAAAKAHLWAAGPATLARRLNVSMTVAQRAFQEFAPAAAPAPALTAAEAPRDLDGFQAGSNDAISFVAKLLGA